MGPTDNYILDYIELLKATKFMLCPKGLGTSSWRLFETMKAGRVPVIISDNWVPPAGPDWDKFSIRIPETKIERIPDFLVSIERDAPALARAAVKAWTQWYSKDTMFNTIVEDCMAIKAKRTTPLQVRSLPYYAATLSPGFIRHWFLADLKRNLMRTVQTTSIK